MRKKFAFFLSLLILLTAHSLFAAGNSPEYDDASVSEEDAEKESERDSGGPVTGFVQGVKQVAYDGPKELVEETAEEATKKPPIVSVVEGVNKGTQKLLDNTVKGAYKVATLGTSDLESYEVQEPEKGSGEPTKIKISIPGT